MGGFIEDGDASLHFLIIWLAVRHAYVRAFAALPLIIVLFFFLIPDGACVLAEVMIGNPAIGLGGLVGLVEECESVVLGLMRDVDFDAFASEVFEGVVVVFAVDGLIEDAVLWFVGVVYVHCFLVYLSFFYFCVVKTVHYRYTK